MPKSKFDQLVGRILLQFIELNSSIVYIEHYNIIICIDNTF